MAWGCSGQPITSHNNDNNTETELPDWLSESREAQLPSPLRPPLVRQKPKSPCRTAAWLCQGARVEPCDGKSWQGSREEVLGEGGLNTMCPSQEQRSVQCAGSRCSMFVCVWTCTRGYCVDFLECVRMSFCLPAFLCERAQTCD